MKRLSNDMAIRLNRLGCKSAELVEVTSWLINQGYFIEPRVYSFTERDGKKRMYYVCNIACLKINDGAFIEREYLTNYSPDYMEAVEMGLQWVLDNKIDPKTTEEETAEEVTQEELQQA